jgi:hypothetical protein
MRKILTSILIMAAMAIAGCATVPHKVVLFYKPQGVAKGGGGKIRLVISEHSYRKDKVPVRWVIGEIMDSEGRQVEEIISPFSPHDQLNDAFKQELESAGYTVVMDSGATSSAEPLLRLSNIRLHLVQRPSLFKITTNVNVSATLEQWKAGSLVKKTEYEASYEDTYSRSQEMQVQTVMQKALEKITSRAVPDIIQTLAK